jgi:uncharacterized protein (DUF2267 family)
MIFDFNRHAEKGNRFLRDLAAELGNRNDTKKAGKVLTAAFFALRNHLTLQENFQLLAQLPIVFKGAYVHNWSPEKKHEVSRKRNDFIMEYLSHVDKNSMFSVADMERGTEEIHAAFRILKKHISPGEYKNMQGVLPSQLKKLLKESAEEKKVTIKYITKNEDALSSN